MNIRELNIFRNLWIAFKEFFKEDGLDKSSVLAYYSIFSSLFLLTFFSFIFTKFLGKPDNTLQTVFPFSPEFFSKVSPEVFRKADEMSGQIREIGFIGTIFSLFLGFLIVKKMVQFVNGMFHIDLHAEQMNKGFWVRRFSEFSLLFIIGLLVVVTFLFTNVVSTITVLMEKGEARSYKFDPRFIEALNSFLLQWAAPFLITFLFFFVLYKWIPNKIVFVPAAFIAALISTICWELGKRLYAYYMINMSIIGKIRGPIIAIILFGFWMELSMGIMLYGAKLTHVFDRANDKKVAELEQLSGLNLNGLSRRQRKKAAKEAKHAKTKRLKPDAPGGA